jgi:hypothetical protein
MMKVRVFKLISGEELIAEIFNYYDQTVELKKPAQIIVQQTERGMGVGLAPYMPYVEGNVSLYRNAIASEGEPVDQMKNEYNRLFGSGITIAPASALAGLQVAS